MFRLAYGLLSVAKNRSETLSGDRAARRKARLGVENLESRLTPDATLIAASYFDSAIYKFNASTGHLAGTLVAPSYSPGITTGLSGLTIGRDNNLYISNQSSIASPDNDSILRYDVTTNTLSTFIDKNTLNAIAAAFGTPDNPSPHFSPAGLLFGPDGDLYVSLNAGQSSSAGRIVRFDMNYNGQVPQYAGTSTTFGDGLVQPSRLLFGTAQGDTDTLYVAGVTGVSKIEDVSAATSSTAAAPFIFANFIDPTGPEYASGLAWAPDGDLLVVDLGPNQPTYNGQVLRYNPDGTHDATDPVFTPAFSLAGQFPSDGIFDPQGNFLTANLGPAYPPNLQGSITRFRADGSLDTSLNATGTLVSSASFPNTVPGFSGISPTQLALIPNQAPVVTVPAGSVNYTEDQAGVVVTTSGTVTDQDSPTFSSGTLTVSLTSNGTVNDVLEIRNQGTGTGQIGVSGSNVTFGGTVIGTFTGGTGGTSLVITFNTASTPAAAQALLRNITFKTVTQAPSPLTRTVSFVLKDEDGATAATATKTVTVTPTNDAPVVTTNSTLTVAENNTIVIPQAKLEATDPDGDVTPAQLTYTVTVAPVHGTVLKSGVPTTTFTQADINAGAISYQNNGDESATDSFKVTVSDGSLSSAAATFNINVTPVNDAPVLSTNVGLTSPENGTVTITKATLETTDPDNTPAQLTYTVTTAPTHGEIHKGGVSVTTFTQADINAGLISYVNDGTIGITSDDFSFSVSDGEAPAVTGTYPITITPINHAPSVTINTGVTALEAGSVVFSQTTLEATDVDGGTPPAQIAYTVTSGPDHGVIKIGGVAVTTFTQADINAGLVSYVNNGDETTSDSFSVTVSDGTDASLTPTVVPLTITPTNDPPVVATNLGMTAAESGSVVFSSLKLEATDPDVGTLPSQLAYTVTVLPAHGSIQIGGVPVTTFTQADINASLVSYVNNGDETTSDSFTVTVSDGTDSTSPAVVLLTITPTNDPPVITTNTGLTVAENDSAPFGLASLATTDPDNTPDQLTYTVTSAPAHGTIRNDGVAVTTFTQADVNAGLVTYQNNGDENASDSFTVTVSDGSLTSSPAVVHLVVTPVNDAPTIAVNAGVTVTENGSVTITTAKLSATDPDNTPAELTYTVTTGATHGTLLKSGIPTTTFTQADINAGIISYHNDGNEFIADAFTVTVSDGTVTTPAFTVAITITPVNDPPTIAVNTGVTVLENGSVSFSTASLSTTDPDNTPAQLTYSIQIGNGPAHGEIRKNGVAVTSFTQADVNAGLISYVNNGDETTSDSFTINVSDGTLSAGPVTVNITVTPQNDPPTVTTNLGLTVNQNTSGEVSQAKLEATDPDNSASQLTYTVITSPTHGTLLKSGTQTTTFTQADINTGTISYLQNNTRFAIDSFVFTVSDGTVTSAPTTFIINVNTVPLVTTQPTAQSGFAGTLVTFTAAASGNPAPTVQWQISTDGTTFTNIPGAITGTYAFAPAAAQNGNLYRAVFTTPAGSVPSDPASLTVKSGLAVLANPVDTTIQVGQTANLMANATGTPKPTVQWQVSFDGGTTFANIPGATRTLLSVKGLPAQDGNLYRAVFANTTGQAITQAATLTVNYTLKLATLGQAVTVPTGTDVTFTVQPKGSPAPTVQWESSSDRGKTYQPILGATSATLTFTATVADTGKLYRAVLTNANGTVKTGAATLTVIDPPVLATSPIDSTILSGGMATFTATAAGTPKPTVQWQVSADGGLTYSNIAGAVAATYKVKATGLLDGNKYRAVFTNTGGQVVTTVAALTVTSVPVISLAPKAQTVVLGNTVTLIAQAKGSPTPTVQWFESSNKGKTYTAITGATSAAFTFTPTALDSGKLYQAVFTNAKGSVKTVGVALTVNIPAAVALDPVGLTVNAGQMASFAVTVTGSPKPTIQWQVSTDGGTTFTNIKGAVAATYKVKATGLLDGNKYRAVVTNSAGTDTSAAADLMVISAPVLG
ncbi:cadherin-like domain-containing protein [Zavarzinella formosa]|uniref:cadherin-like domain-containing protein n=1 Tax=Zavarzinella formosa TaxID=360055 RepID=UPI00036B6D10|nr:cadherin-like domain-containing protein [Zavarzinella formosa]